jgi:predicted outer membrane repeat protein
MVSKGNCFLFLLSTALFSCLLVSNVSANTLSVTNLDDYGSGSLRQAIVDASAGDIISIAVNGTISTQSALSINKSLTIQGPGAANLTISRDPNAGYYSVIYIDSAVDLSLQGIKITNGTGTDINGAYYGGAIYVSNGSSLLLNNSTISGNGTPSYGFGGGIYGQGTISITDSEISGNRANGSSAIGGGIYNVGTLTITNSTISGNFSDVRYGMAGGIYSDGALTITKSTISGNYGGGMWGSVGGVYSHGTLTITDSTVADNSACVGGGGIQSNGTLTISNCTISGNNSHHGSGGIESYGTLTVTNSTLSGNSSNVEWGTASVYSYDPNGTSKIESTTISGRASWVTNVDVNNWGGDIVNSVVIGNCNSDRNAVNSWVSDGSCAATYSGDPLIGPLADNGGPNKTHALLFNSPLIDRAGSCTGVDQRGVARPQGAGCDLGAYEAIPLNITAPQNGEILLKGSTYKITWTYLAYPDSKVKIELLKSGEVVSIIAGNFSIGSNGSGHFDWKVPNIKALGSDYQVRISSTSIENTTTLSTGYFTIQ